MGEGRVDVLAGKRIVLGVCGGIAAYKALELLRILTAQGALVTPVLTDNATRFVGALSFSALATNPAVVGMWGGPDPSPHTTLGQSADLILIAPATARFIASYANGSSDDLLSTTVLASRAPVVVCPAMHTEMWEHAAVVANVATLKSRGIHVVEPESGPLAGGDVGPGRFAGPDAVMFEVEQALTRHQDLAGRTLVVTAGGTREPIDAVRYIGNRSSGRQGYAVAEAAVARGARVVLISAASLPALFGADVVAVSTAAEMHDAVLENMRTADVLVMAAAVADFRPSNVSSEKLPKKDGPPKFELVPTLDIVAAAARQRTPHQVIVGFAAETGDEVAKAKDKLERKGLDLIVANDVSRPGVGFEYVTNEVTIVDKNGTETKSGLVDKRIVAEIILDSVVEMFDRRSRLGE